MSRIFFFLFGFGLMTIGFVYIILYLNILSIGYNFSYYVNFISRRIECYYTIIGFLIILGQYNIDVPIPIDIPFPIPFLAFIAWVAKPII